LGNPVERRKVIPSRIVGILITGNCDELESQREFRMRGIIPHQILLREDAEVVTKQQIENVHRIHPLQTPNAPNTNPYHLDSAMGGMELFSLLVDSR
jgi:hypothetical protein